MGRRTSRAMRVSIQTRGRLSLNQLSFENLGRPESVVLLFDLETRAVGIKSSSSGVDHAFPVRHQRDSKSYLIRSLAFFEHYKIDISVAKAFVPQIEDGILVFELDRGTERKRRKKEEMMQEPDRRLSHPPLEFERVDDVVS